MKELFEDLAKVFCHSAEEIASQTIGSDDQAITEVQRIAKYAASGSEFGIPWSLWVRYVAALEKRQITSLTSTLKPRDGLVAPVIGTPNSAVEITKAKWVYPVIK